MEKLKEYLLAALLIFTLLVPVIPVGALSLYQSKFAIQTSEEFETEEIPYEKLTEESDYEDVGYEEVTTEGEVGLIEIEYEVKRRDGRIISRTETDRTVVRDPIDQITTIGTYEEEYDDEPIYRTGAICWDGSYSSATGRGACSHHGGVREWLYNY